MIIKGKSRKEAAQAGRYLLSKGVNDRVELIEIKQVIASDVKGAMQEMEALAKCTRCEKFLYHASVNLKKGENLTPNQWRRAVDELEKNLCFQGHQRVVVEHEKEGRIHRHIIWNRINHNTMRAVHMSNSFMNHEKTARLLEKEFDLEIVKGIHFLEINERPAGRGPTKYEITESEKSGINIYEWREEIRQIGVGKKGAKYIAELESRGHMVAKGYKVDFVILDPSGAAHRMAQSLGVKVKDLKARLSDIDYNSLPSVDQAQVRQKEKKSEIEFANTLEGKYRSVQVRTKLIRHSEENTKEVNKTDRHKNRPGTENDRDRENTDKEHNYDLTEELGRDAMDNDLDLELE